MLHDWQVLHVSAVSGAVRGELPFLQASHADALNGVGSWSVTVPFDEPDSVTIPDGAGGVTTLDRSAVIDFSDLGVGRTVVHFVKNGVVLGSGILWGIALDYAAGVMQLTGSGLASYYERRITLDASFTGTEQLDIARALIAAADADPDSIGMTANTNDSGVNRDRSYLTIEAKPVLESLSELGAVSNGFDWRFRAHYEAGDIVRRLHFDYPATGRQTDHVFEVGTNCALFSYSEDGADLAHYVLGVGAGDGADDKLTVSDFEPPVNEALSLDASISHVDVSDPTTLAEHVARRLTRGKKPIRRIGITVVPDTEPVLGSFDVGDIVRVRARKGWLNVDDSFRIVDLAITLDSSGEQVQLTLAGLETFE